MFDWQQHLRETAQWYLDMQEMPGFQGHARHRVKELMAQPEYEKALPAMFEQLRKEAADAARCKG